MVSYGSTLYTAGADGFINLFNMELDTAGSLSIHEARGIEDKEADETEVQKLNDAFTLLLRFHGLYF